MLRTPGGYPGALCPMNYRKKSLSTSESSLASPSASSSASLSESASALAPTSPSMSLSESATRPRLRPATPVLACAPSFAPAPGGALLRLRPRPRQTPRARPRARPPPPIGGVTAAGVVGVAGGGAAAIFALARARAYWDREGYEGSYRSSALASGPRHCTPTCRPARVCQTNSAVPQPQLTILVIRQERLAEFRARSTSAFIAFYRA